MTDAKPSPVRPIDEEAIAIATRLLRQTRFGALGVLDPANGAPMVSRVATAPAMDGAPVILISSLAAHTGALLADPRCSLLIGEPGKGDPLAHPRMTLACHATRLNRESAKGIAAAKRYLAFNPKASLYAGFTDFSWFELTVHGASLNGGFGKAWNFSATDIIMPAGECAAIAALEADTLDTLNAHHADALNRAAYAIVAMKSGQWKAIALDPTGVDLVCGSHTARLEFPVHVRNKASLDREINGLVT